MVSYGSIKVWRGDKMSKNIRTLYLYIVSFIALGMIVVGVICTVRACASYFFPVVSYYDTSDSKEEVLIRERNKKTESVKEAISSGTVVIIGIPLYLYHFGKAQKEKNTEV